MYKERYINEDGEVGVLVSGGYGAGWSTWESEHSEEMMFDPELVELVLQEKFDECAEVAARKYNAYTGGAYQLHVEWLAVGTPFRITEYDGSEGLETLEHINFTIA